MRALAARKKPEPYMRLLYDVKFEYQKNKIGAYSFLAMKRTKFSLTRRPASLSSASQFSLRASRKESQAPNRACFSSSESVAASPSPFSTW